MNVCACKFGVQSWAEYYYVYVYALLEMYGALRGSMIKYVVNGKEGESVWGYVNMGVQGWLGVYIHLIGVCICVYESSKLWIHQFNPTEVLDIIALIKSKKSVLIK